MSRFKQFSMQAMLLGVVTFLNVSNIFSMQQSDLAQIQRVVADVRVSTGNAVFRSNEALALAYSANGTTIKAFELAKEASALASSVSSDLQEAQATVHDFGQQVQAASVNLIHEAERLSAQLRQDSAEEQIKAEKVAAEIAKAILVNKNEPLEERIAVAQASAQIMAQGNVEAEKARGSWICSMLGNTQFLVKVALVIVITVLCICIIKYGLPILIEYFTQPRVIIETSRSGIFGWFKSKQDPNIDDLIFVPPLQKQLLNLTLRVQSAKRYNEALPNVLFYGASGTGKTAFAKALARASGLDYALTSGSEFAKIKNLNNANKELRKLLNWAKKSKGLIIFIDEVESLFADRRLSTTSQKTQDFINSFLSLISDQSQKRVMFIFATNYPSKLDEAITNRVGINIEFTLPGPIERRQILLKYLIQFSQENKNAIVKLNLDISKMLSKYAVSLENFSPRAIKFVAETMIIRARRQAYKTLTNEIAQAVIDEAKYSLKNAINWKKEAK